MDHQTRARGPAGNLATYTPEQYSHDAVTHRVWRKGDGPAVIVLTEMPGISHQVVGFADRVVALGCTAVLPDLFGSPGADPAADTLAGGARMVTTILRACVSREFTTWAMGRSSPVTRWLRGLAAAEHERCGGPGVGVVGMCFTGGFALAMAVDPVVVAPVLSQPSLPIGLTAARRRTIDCASADLEVVAGRCARDGLRVLGLRFDGDRFCPAERFAFLAERLGEGFVAVQLRQQDGHPQGFRPFHHSVLTGDLIDEPGEPTRTALDQVLTLFATRLQVR